MNDYIQYPLGSPQWMEQIAAAQQQPPMEAPGFKDILDAIASMAAMSLIMRGGIGNAFRNPAGTRGVIGVVDNKRPYGYDGVLQPAGRAERFPDPNIPVTDNKAAIRAHLDARKTPAVTGEDKALAAQIKARVMAKRAPKAEAPLNPYATGVTPPAPPTPKAPKSPGIAPEVP